MLYKIYTMIFDIDDQNEDKMYMVESLYTQMLKGATKAVQSNAKLHPIHLCRSLKVVAS